MVTIAELAREFMNSLTPSEQERMRALAQAEALIETPDTPITLELTLTQQAACAQCGGCTTSLQDALS